MNKKVNSAEEAVKRIKDGDTVMVGGFLQGGIPEELVRALVDTNSADNLTIISNDTGTTELSIYRLVKSGRVKRIFASYIGSNPETGRLLMTKEAEVQLFPQGTLAEKIRAGGAGLGGFLTPVGVGTIVEEGKQKIKIDEREYLLELPLKADVALIRAHKADEAGNLVINGTSRNFNMVMATAAEYVVAQTDEYVKAGEIDPNHINVPGIFVDAIVKVGGDNE
ncbi:CoA transferase subunit A [Paenibacillus sp. P2(2022)]|uniref:Acetate CoA-transferase subunit alpha n=1 Tax=Paenibacillus polymyxa TaxID=1406 RepID=A0A378XTN8_PAEPO|nr:MULTISPECIES: CoA transferase subunit A [Paenibacillus]MEB4781156.1 CoA transferase subunit A [Paenibacillus jamilae]KJK31826.1 branched-chain amino acid dehydrogenase [Paenibacillus polymyxa]MBE7897930.1 CoA transferase subunit A [Paenibacillus polymyxa]MBG9764460.1 branched-chain amino acid dehydrogenase [Paenibacillus polymyxa]MBY7736780.1 CoA transferase subunit A [Paenibacillus polymyxa]